MQFFTFKDKCCVQWVMWSDRPYNCTISLQLTGSFHGMHDVSMIRMGVLFVGGIIWVRLQVACNFFLEAYEYVFQSAYRIPCINMQCSYILIGNLLQKKL